MLPITDASTFGQLQLLLDSDGSKLADPDWLCWRRSTSSMVSHSIPTRRRTILESVSNVEQLRLEELIEFWPEPAQLIAGKGSPELAW
jgi:hypothetical protein